MAAMLRRILPVLFLLRAFGWVFTDEKFVIRSLNSNFTLVDSNPEKSHVLTYMIKPWPPDWRVSNSSEFEAYEHVWIRLYNDTTSQLLCQAQYDKGLWRNESFTDSCWERSGNRISNFEPGMIGDAVEFKLNSVTLWDMQSYSLTIIDFFQKQYKGTVNLTVMARPASPKLSLSKAGDLDEGDNVTLRCWTMRAWPPPDLQWFRARVPIDRITTVQRSISTTWWGESWARFSWLARKEDHNVVFSCTASNRVGELTAPHRMAVTFPPQVLITQCESNRPYPVMVKRYAELHCDVTNAYPGVHTWTWVSPTGSILSTNKTQLEFPNVEKTDSGNYSCHAVNLKGSGSHWCTIDVQYGVTVTLPVNMTFKEFAMVSIPCQNEANPKPTTFKWTKDEDLQFEFPNETLQFSSVRPEHAGIYKCVAYNSPIGETWQDSGFLKLLVEYKPRLAKYSLTKYASRPEQVATLKCAVRAYPTATVSWRYMDHNITNGPRHTISVDQSASMLQISNVRDADFGLYQCGATNSEGTDVFRIELLKPGKPDPPQECHSSRVGDRDLTLMCTAGYAGGEQLTFSVSRSIQGQDSSKWAEVEVTWPNIYNPEEDAVAEVKVSGFGPNTNYTLQVYGDNKHGRSETAIALRIRTADGPPLPTSPPPNIGAIVGGTFGSILVIFIIGAVFYVWAYGTPEVPKVLRRKLNRKDDGDMLNRLSTQNEDLGSRYGQNHHADQGYGSPTSSTEYIANKQEHFYTSLAEPNQYVPPPDSQPSAYSAGYMQQDMADGHDGFRQHSNHQGNFGNKALGYVDDMDQCAYANVAYLNDEQAYANEPNANEIYAYEPNGLNAHGRYNNDGRNNNDIQVTAEVYCHQDQWSQHVQNQRKQQSNLAGMGALAGSHVVLNYDLLGQSAATKVQENNKSSSLNPLMEGLSVIENRHEHPRHHLSFRNKLGEGVFGEVWHAYAENLGGRKGRQNVAVKLIKESCPPEERSSLWCELEVLKLLKPHPNVVSLLGACTDREPLLVILEYCSRGNLLEFLRKNRIVPSGMHPAVRGVTLTTRTLTCFVIQIANGMDYIASNGLLHRDLAARNVLMDDRLTCKVSDFGFARDIAHTRQYEGKTRRRLPVRWMAPESLYDCIYSTKSDIWAFGVTVWEVMTLGSSPYPGLTAHDVMELINTGLRMQKPLHCSAPMYSVMKDCWRPTPQQRPSWTALSMRLTAILEDLDDNPEEVINVNAMEESMFAILTDLPEEKC